MNDSKSISPHTTTFPLLALMFASAISVILTGLRVVQTGHWGYVTLSWNLFLAWLPLVFALGASRMKPGPGRNGWRFYLMGGLWLLFFPNAPYIFTDLIHLNTWFLGHYWVDLTLILLVAMTGFLLGFTSLYLMHSMVAERVGRPASWLFILIVTGLSGFGIYLGRILRWNSWDVLVHPVGLSHDIGHWAAHPLANSTSVAFPALFAVFLFLGYLMLYALTHLQPAPARDAAA
jgi:uncharacterized membrane protein